jgi:Ca2+-binding EF-hand superfamily protein
METKSQEWIEKTEAKIREAFDLFDKDKSDAIIQVWSIMVVQIFKHKLLFVL